MYNKKILNKSINQLLGINFDETPAYDSFLVLRSKELCKKKIAELAIEDFRLLIGQGIALQYIVPFALDILAENLFAEGDYYEGDLLKSVLTLDLEFWEQNKDLKKRLLDICTKDFHKIDSLDLSNEIKKTLRQKLNLLFERET